MGNMQYHYDDTVCAQIGKNGLQNPGMYALLDAVKASTSSSLKLLSFEGLTVTLDLEKTIEGMKESHPNLKIVHGGTGGYQVRKPLPTPMEKLTQYCRDNNVRLIDLFRNFDKEQLNVLPETEFRNALRVSTLLEFYCVHVLVKSQVTARVTSYKLVRLV